MTYATPAVESQEPIAEAFVLGLYFTPTWADQSDQENRSPS
jgi:hypothetical protein